MTLSDPYKITRQKLQSILSELKAAFNALYRDQLVQLVLFGSHARGDTESGSDIDIMLILKGPMDFGLETSKILDITAPLSLENDVVISCLCMANERYQFENTPLLRNIRQEGIVF